MFAMTSPAGTVKVVETSRVTPFSDSPKSATEFSLPFTYFDTLWFAIHQVERIFSTNSTSTQVPRNISTRLSSQNSSIPSLSHSSITSLSPVTSGGRRKIPRNPSLHTHRTMEFRSQWLNLTQSLALFQATKSVKQLSYILWSLG